MELGTTHRNDYVPFKTGPIEKWNPDKKYPSIKAPFPGVSSYKNNYINYSAGMPPREKATVVPTVISELPFIGKTTNTDYGSFPPIVDIEKGDNMIKPAHKSMYKNPLGPDIPFMGETTMQGDFKPFKIGKNQKGPKGNEVNDALPNYDGQYHTVYKKDYCCGKYRRCPDCPIRKTKHETIKASMANSKAATGPVQAPAPAPAQH